VCPSRLRTKWQQEMSRKFGQDFSIFGRREVEGFLRRVEEDPTKGRLRGIISQASMRSKDLLEKFVSVVEELDLLIVDEAHHARNPGTLTTAMVGELGRISAGILLLTATPLHLKSRDLFTLLAHLRPTEFTSPEVFDAQLERHRGILEALAIVRSGKVARLEEAAAKIESVYRAPDGRTVTDPVAVRVMRRLRVAPPTETRGWVELARQVDELHLLGGIVSRTRKREVQEQAPVRRSNPIAFSWTEEEDRLYRAVLGEARKGGWPTSGLSLGQIQRARQAASCLPAALMKWGGELDPDELCDIDVTELDSPSSADEPLPENLTSGTTPDTKFENLLAILQQIEREEPGAKVLVFTFFVGTSHYLERRLSEHGWNPLRIAGDVPANPHDPDRDERGQRIEAFETDSDARVLVSTEVGSEGLDFQFCHHVVNYDLPWNPMVVEQRIGRVDRFGQESDFVQIHTLVVKGTVEDRILHRLYDRIGIFEQSIGYLEVILGETVRELRQDYVSGRLTPDEADRRVEEAARAIENNRHETEKLERSAGELFGHEDYIRDEMRRVRRLGRYLSERALLALIRGYLERHHPGVRIKNEGRHGYSIAVSDALHRDVLDRSEGKFWDGYLRCRGPEGRLHFTFDGETAFRRKRVDLINAAHPLVRAAVDALSGLLEDPVARVSQAVVTLAHGSDEATSLADGLYFVAVFAQDVGGIRSRTILEPVACRAFDGELLDAEVAERLLHCTLDGGIDWDRKEHAPGVPEELWRTIESEARRRNRNLREREQEDNDASVQRRRRVLEAERDQRLRLIERKSATARQRGRRERILALFEAQRLKAQGRFAEKLRKLDEHSRVSVTLSEPLAVCAVEVRHEDSR